MTENARAMAAAMNREIVDDQPARLAIHTHRIRLTQANLPYQPVAGKRLASEKHFAVYADQIVLAGVLQNPGRDIELHAREIIIEQPATLDVGGADADKDFRPGDAPLQKDAQPGAAGTDGANGTDGGSGGRIVIDAYHVVNRAPDGGTLSVADVAALGARVFAEHPPKLEDACALPVLEAGRTKMWGGSEIVINLENGRVEGLGQVTLQAARFDPGSGRIALQLALAGLKVTGTTNAGNGRIASQGFGCVVDVSARLNPDGSLGEPRRDLSLVTDRPIKLPVPYMDGTLSGSALDTVRDRVATHVGAAAEPLLKAVGDRLRAAALTLLAGGGRGGRGQDGHAGDRGEAGPAGARTTRHGVQTDNGPGFPEDAIGKNGLQGGRAGSPGASGNGGRGGAVELNVMLPPNLAVVYSTAGGEGGVPASPGERGPGGHGGAGTVCRMFDGKTGRPVEDQKAPDGKDGSPGPPAERAGTRGAPGAAGSALKVNGGAYTGGTLPAYSFAALAPALSLGQLLVTQNATDQQFLNAKTEDDLVAAADGYTWLIHINEPFTDPAVPIDAARVPRLEQQVRARIHDSAVVSLMRLQQGLDYFGHSYNWTPVLNLTSLLARTQEIILLGKVIEDQFNRYLDTSRSSRERMKAFDRARQEIDQKLGDLLGEIETLTPQIRGFEAQVEGYTRAMVRQRTLLLEGQLKFKDELIAHLRKENDLTLDIFLDILGTVIGCVGGVSKGVGGIKTAVDAVRKAEKLSEKFKKVVEVFTKAKATLASITKAYSSIKETLDDGTADAAKILVDGDEFNEMLKEYLGKIDAAGELRKAMDYYLTLAQARNMAAYNYTTLVAQVLALQTQHDQLYGGIQHINAEMAAHQDNVLPIYTAYLKDAYEDVQRSLLRNLYQENRAYQYWSLRDRQLRTDDLNIATLAATHERLKADIDTFRENSDSFSPFNQKVVVSADQYPSEFAEMRTSRVLTFALDIRREPGFQNMRYVIAREFTLKLPEVQGGSHVLFLNLVHSGEAVLNSDTDLDNPGALHVFSHRPRVSPFKIDYKDPDNMAGGTLGEDKQGYIGLSPFTLWRLDFGLKGNEWLDLDTVNTVVLTFSGRMLGPAARMNASIADADSPGLVLQADA
ncbi:hypothetical protein [Longimicrobium sp.]|uniref:hypothetical protein n=1 Tax=Longimicrobium sp. TaxID=2029185 RepID=UPI002E2FC65A|nr:hypothetical protein [Longimicrobium sp.]HEX6041070.1 hypothetical protein [Longimicrobium sp.]